MTKKIAITIPSFLRFDKLFQEISSIKKFYPKGIHTIYIGDQDKPYEDKIMIYNNLRKKGYKIYQLPFNCGAIYTRNYLIKQTKEPYTLVIDNDFLFNKQSTLKSFIEILKENKNIGIVGGIVNKRLGRNKDYTYDLIL